MENIQTNKHTENETEEIHEYSALADFVFFLSRFVSLPLFLLLHKTLPDPNWVFHLDRILLFVLTVTAVELLFFHFRILITLGFFVALIVLSYNSYHDGYGFAELYADYLALLKQILNTRRLPA